MFAINRSGHWAASYRCSALSAKVVIKTRTEYTRWQMKLIDTAIILPATVCMR